MPFPVSLGGDSWPKFRLLAYDLATPVVMLINSDNKNIG